MIDLMGGPAKLAAELGFDPLKGGVQRVHNWRTRGIPAAVRLEHRETFMAAQAKAAQAAPTASIGTP